MEGAATQRRGERRRSGRTGSEAAARGESAGGGGRGRDQDHLFTLEKELALAEDATVVYILYDGGDSWWVVPASRVPKRADRTRRTHSSARPGRPECGRVCRRVQAAPPGLTTFASRKALPDPWRGLRDAALSAAVGVDGCVFVRTSGG